MPKNKTGFYAVKKGSKPGVYSTWSECEAQVKGFPGAVYQKFRTFEEATAFIGQATTTSIASTSGGSSSGFQKAKTAVGRTTQSLGRPGQSPSSPKGSDRQAQAGSGSESRIKSKSNQKHNVVEANKEADRVDDSDRTTNVVCTDGACTNNGKLNAVAGIGVWWGHNDPRNLSERCPGSQTNNRAELIALIRTLEEAPLGGEGSRLIIKTDSQYSISCVQTWARKWESTGWKKANGGEVLNANLIRYLLALLQLRSAHGEMVTLRHVYGHTGHEGNEGADELARGGTVQRAIPDRDWEAERQRVERKIDSKLGAQSEKRRSRILEDHLEVQIEEDDLLSLEEMEELEKTQQF